MKDSLFELLLNLVEKTLSQLKETRLLKSAEAPNDNDPLLSDETDFKSQYIKAAQETSLRVFTEDEQFKLTKSSYQFLMRMLNWRVIAPEVLELIINQLLFSQSRFVNLQETKWTIRKTLADVLNGEQLAFLDLVLYHKEDNVNLH